MFFCTKELGVVKTNCKEHKLYIITLPASQMLDHTIYSNKDSRCFLIYKHKYPLPHDQRCNVILGYFIPMEDMFANVLSGLLRKYLY